jgi:hypothetical protein
MALVIAAIGETAENEQLIRTIVQALDRQLHNNDTAKAKSPDNILTTGFIVFDANAAANGYKQEYSSLESLYNGIRDNPN